MKTSVREINDVDELAAYRGVWDALLAETPDATFFQSLDWLESYWKHYGHGQRLRVLVVCDEGNVVGILPLVVRTEATKVGRIRFLTYPLDYWGSFYGPVGPTPDRILQDGLRHIRATKRDWDALELRWVGCSRADRLRTEGALKSARFGACDTVLNHTSIIDLSGTWEGYLASRTGKWRNNYRRWQRRLAARGEVTYQRYRPRGTMHNDADPRWDLFDACLEIAERSWQGSMERGTTLSHPRIRPFLTDVHEVAARAGALDLNLLRLDGQPIAFAYNYHYRGHLFGLRIGYDAAASRDGVGNLLYTRAIEDSFLRGDRIYDMGPGSLECKRKLQTSIEPILRYSHFPLRSVRSQLVRWKRNRDRISNPPPRPTCAAS